MNSLSEFSGGYFPESVQCVLPLIDVYQVFDTGDYSFWEFWAEVVSFFIFLNCKAAAAVRLDNHQ